LRFGFAFGLDFVLALFVDFRETRTGPIVQPVENHGSLPVAKPLSVTFPIFIYPSLVAEDSTQLFTEAFRRFDFSSPPKHKHPAVKTGFERP
jgi:hypothetical protein